MRTADQQKMHHQSTPKLNSYILFSVGFFLLVTLLTAIFIIPSITNTIEENYQLELELDSQLEAEVFLRYIDNAQSLLADVATNPNLTNAVLLAETGNPKLSDHLDHVTIKGEKSRLVLQDIAGNILFKTGGDFQASYDVEAPWLMDVLDGKVNYHLQLLSQKNNQFSFKISIPVLYRNSIEGVLSAEITDSFDALFVGPEFQNKIAFRLAQGNTVLQSLNSRIKLPRETDVNLDAHNLTFTYISDESEFKDKTNRLTSTILYVLFAALGISFIFFFIFAYRTLVREVQAVEKPQWERSYLLPLVLAIIGLIASFTAYQLAENAERSAFEDKFIANSKENIEAMREHIARKQEVLKVLKAYFDTSDDSVSRQEFKDFSLPLIERHPSIQSLQWAPYVSQAERAQYEQGAREAGFNDFAFTARNAQAQLLPAPTNSDGYYPVYYLAPMAGNEKAFGLTLNNKLYNQAMLYAQETGQITATPPLHLVQDNTKRPAYILYAPLYENAATYPNIASRKAHIKGFNVLVLRADHLIASSLASFLNPIDFFIEDITEKNHHQAVYGQQFAPERFTYAETIHFAGRTWRVVASPSSMINQHDHTWMPAIALLLGLALTALVTWLLINQIRRRTVVEQLVNERTAELTMINDLVANSNDVFMITDAGAGLPNQRIEEPKILYVNDAFIRLTGYTKDEVLGESPRLLNGENTDHQAIMLLGEVTGRGELFKGEYINYKKSGEEFWAEVTCWSLKDEHGVIIQYCSVLRDVTALKEEAIKRQDLQLAMQSAVEGVSKINPEGRYIYVNDAYASVVGYLPDELVGKKWEITIVEDELVRMAQVYETMLAEGKVTAETIGLCKDGSTVDKQVTMISDYDAKGNFVGHFCFLQDISLRKLAEKEREQLITKLIDSNEELARFAFICSHDLQEPLRMIRSFSERIQTHMGDTIEKDEKSKRYFKYLTDGATLAQKLIADILSYARLENDQEQAEMIDLNRTFETIMDTLEVNHLDNSGKVTSDPLPEVYGHKTQLYQLFKNLITNGLKYHLPEVKPTVHVSAQDVGSHWQISIKDNGIGIDAAYQEKIFEVFQRLHGRSEYSGTGIGLAICKKVVKRHGGIIWLESEKGKGTTFYFTIEKTNTIEAINIGDS